MANQEKLVASSRLQEMEPVPSADKLSKPGLFVWEMPTLCQAPLCMWMVKTAQTLPTGSSVSASTL